MATTLSRTSTVSPVGDRVLKLLNNDLPHYPPEAVPRTKVSDHIYDHIVTRIFRGELCSGDRILESDLVEGLQVSKVSVREALVKLAKDGWVQSRPNQGTYVTDYSEPQKLVKLYRARLTMEVGAFCQLVQEPDQEGIERLGELVSSLEAAYEAKDLLLYRTENVKFHCTAVHLAGGPILERTFQNILMQVFSFVPYPKEPERYMAVPTEDALPVPSHREILEVLKKQEVMELVRLVHEHVLSGAYAAGIEVGDEERKNEKT